MHDEIPPPPGPGTPHGAESPWIRPPHPVTSPPPLTRHPPCAVHAGRYGQQAGDMHPTGIQSCFYSTFTCIGSRHFRKYSDLFMFMLSVIGPILLLATTAAYKNQLFFHVRLTWCEKHIQNTCKPFTCDIAFAFAFLPCEQSITCYVSQTLHCNVKIINQTRISVHLLPSLTLRQEIMLIIAGREAVDLPVTN